MSSERLQKGIEMRSAVLSREYVEGMLTEADDFNRPFQEMMTEFCWGFGWGDDTLPPKTRSMLNLTMIAALNRMAEWELHFRGAIRNGCTQEELRAILHIISIYCGIPAGVQCFRIANRVLKELAEGDQ